MRATLDDRASIYILSTPPPPDDLIVREGFHPKIHDQVVVENKPL